MFVMGYSDKEVVLFGEGFFEEVIFKYDLEGMGKKGKYWYMTVLMNLKTVKDRFIGNQEIKLNSFRKNNVGKIMQSWYSDYIENTCL